MAHRRSSRDRKFRHVGRPRQIETVKAGCAPANVLLCQNSGPGSEYAYPGRVAASISLRGMLVTVVHEFIDWMYFDDSQIALFVVDNSRVYLNLCEFIRISIELM
jgi:hypothetical protein